MRSSCRITVMCLSRRKKLRREPTNENNTAKRSKSHQAERPRPSHTAHDGWDGLNGCCREQEPERDLQCQRSPHRVGGHMLGNEYAELCGISDDEEAPDERDRCQDPERAAE